MQCREAQGELSAYLDGELSPEERRAVEEHLRECADCGRELASLRATVGLVRSLPSRSAPPGLPERIGQRLAEEEAAPKRRGWVRKLWPALAAAGIGLVILFYSPREPRGVPEHAQPKQAVSRTEALEEESRPALAMKRDAEPPVMAPQRAARKEKLGRRDTEGTAVAPAGSAPPAVDAEAEKRPEVAFAEPVTKGLELDEDTALAETQVRESLDAARKAAEAGPQGPEVAKADALEEGRTRFRDLETADALDRVRDLKKSTAAKREEAKAQELREDAAPAVARLKAGGAPERKAELEALAAEKPAAQADAVKAKAETQAVPPPRPVERAVIEVAAADTQEVRGRILADVRAEGATLLPAVREGADRREGEVVVRFRCSQKQLILLMRGWLKQGFKPRYVSKGLAVRSALPAEEETVTRQRRSMAPAKEREAARGAGAAVDRQASSTPQPEEAKPLEVIVRFAPAEKGAAAEKEK